MVDLERIRAKIQVIQDELAKLDQIAKYDYEAFRSTPFVADASLRNLQIIIEALIDVSSHIVARQNLGLQNICRRYQTNGSRGYYTGGERRKLRQYG